MPKLNYIPGEDPDNAPNHDAHKRRERKRRKQMSSILGSGNIEPAREKERHGKKRLKIDGKPLIGEIYSTQEGEFFLAEEDGSVYNLRSKEKIDNDVIIQAVLLAERKRYADEVCGFDIDIKPIDLVPQEIKNKAAENYHEVGQAAIVNPETGEDVYGFLYTIGEDENTKEYLYDAENDTVWLYGWSDEVKLITDPEIIKNIKEQVEKDQEIDKARQQVAELLSAKVELQQILRWHMEYTRGGIRPTEKDGIVFYQVGHNASHEFYAGYKDGQLYEYTCGESWEPEDNPNLPGISEYVRPVEEFGYMGHF